ncbi:MAG: hypothetical protein V7731_09920 [Amphritea sp.]
MALNSKQETPWIVSRRPALLKFLTDDLQEKVDTAEQNQELSAQRLREAN